MIAAVGLITVGALGAVPSLVGLVGLLIEGSLTSAAASSPLIVLLCGAILIVGGILLYRRVHGRASIRED
jgi:hypothetical protein